jgi:formylglycine-generating enzyme required for sulfatase activity/CheY-like chemotaxis protein
MKILLVDDEAQVLSAWKELLEASGPGEVQTASLGGQALQAARQMGGPDVLVTDVVMEPMDGFTLREKLTAEFPGMRTVFVSGYDLTDYADRTAGATVLTKPVEAAQLAAALGVDREPPVAAPAEEVPGPGMTIGAYYLQEPAGHSGVASDYLAWQQSMSRHVVLHVLDSAQAGNEEVVREFLADARAKAAVTHPYLLAVHEAGEAGGYYFYSSDLVPGHTLEAYAAAGHQLDDKVLLHALRTAAEVSGYFKQQGLARRAISPADVVLDGSMRPRLANVAEAGEANGVDEAAEVRAFAATLGRMAAPGGPAAGAMATLLAAEAPDWSGALQLAATAKPAAAPKDAGKLSARSEKAKELLAKSREQQKKRLMITAALSLVLLLVGAFALYSTLRGGTRSVTTKMVRIPAGEFIYQDGEKVTLPEFWIDEHEVTIADYKEFLDYLEANPGEAAKFAHPDMPEGKSHIPLDWADNTQLSPPMPGYYKRAVRWKQYKDAPLDVDSPVFNLDWYDAYAYAKWKGRRLPTEQEWEKAARGTDGRTYPWGNEEDPKRANTGHDFNPDPKEGGELDGFKRWSPVNLPRGDESAFGVRGMAGNVSEWTATYAPSEDGMGGDVPVVRGGNWGNPEHNITRRRAILDPLQVQDTLGFRTVSDTAP